MKKQTANTNVVPAIAPASVAIAPAKELKAVVTAPADITIQSMLSMVTEGWDKSAKKLAEDVTRATVSTVTTMKEAAIALGEKLISAKDTLQPEQFHNLLKGIALLKLDGMSVSNLYALIGKAKVARFQIRGAAIRQHLFNMAGNGLVVREELSKEQKKAGIKPAFILSPFYARAIADTHLDVTANMSNAEAETAVRKVVILANSLRKADQTPTESGDRKAIEAKFVTYLERYKAKKTFGLLWSIFDTLARETSDFDEAERFVQRCKAITDGAVPATK